MHAVSHDPFGWRIRVTCADAGVATRLLGEMTALEAEELAAGRRHLTVEHGAPGDLLAADDLDGFYDEVSDLLMDLDDVRLAGGDDYLTVTLHRSAEDLLQIIGEAALRRGWTVVDGPVPPSVAAAR